MSVEDLDRRIVALLAADGRLSYTDLGRITGLSTSAAHQRVKRLEQRGIITGYRAVVDWTSVGLPLTALISVSPIDPAQPDDLPDRLVDIADIQSCWSVAGDDEYVLLVRVASPLDLEQLLGRIRTTAHVTTRTTVVLSTPYEDRPAAISDAG
jgi:Lrp/AsnC family leucine-responsive transcriptional regulator